MFLFKKILTPLFFPLSVSLLIMLIGLILLVARRRENLGKLPCCRGDGPAYPFQLRARV